MRKTAAQLADDITSLASGLTGQSDVGLRIYYSRYRKEFTAEVACKPPRKRDRWAIGRGSSPDGAIQALAKTLGVAL